MIYKKVYNYWARREVASYSLTSRLISLQNRAGEIPMLYNNYLWTLSILESCELLFDIF